MKRRAVELGLRLPRLFDELAEGVLLLTPGGRLRDMNRTALNLCAGRRDDFIGRLLIDIEWWLDDDSRTQLSAALRQAASGQRQCQQFGIRIGERAPALLDLALSPLVDTSGAVTALLCELRDISDRRQLKRALREQERELERAQQLAHVGSWRWEVAPDRVHWSDELSRMFGLDPGQAPPGYAEHANLYTVASWEQLQQAVRRCLAEAAPYKVELEFIRADGSQGWMESHGEAERDSTGNIAVLRGTAQDVSQRHALQEAMARELTQARDLAGELEARSQRERELLHFLAHEVRQPLHNASAALQHAAAALRTADDAVDAEVLSPLDRAEQVIGHVIGALNNTLAAATLLIDGGRHSFADTDLDALVNLVLLDVAADERARICVQRRSAARTVSLQPNLTRLALFNLLANALAYSPAASPVELTIFDSEEPLSIGFEVRDHGGGIPEDLRPRLGERGLRGRNTAHRQGGGLGLYIVAQVVQLHRGELSLQPVHGGGTLARMTLPQGV